MPEIDLASAIQTNWIKLGTLEMEATGSKLIVVQDEFHSGYECTTCGAKDIRMISQSEQRSVVVCSECGGKGYHDKMMIDQGDEYVKFKCSHCEGKGWLVCPACNGTGTYEGGLAHSQDSERRPTTGTIVSVGWMLDPSNWYARLRRWFKGAVTYRRGDSVIYPSFAGDFFDLEAADVNGNDVKVTIGILSETDVIARVRGHLELRRVKSRKALHTAA